MKGKRTCIVCGKQYEYCMGCRRPNQPSWLNIYHDKNCKDIWDAITTDYDQRGAVHAANKLSDLDLSDMDNFRVDVKEKIEKIFSEAFGDDVNHIEPEEEANEEVVFDNDFDNEE